MEELGAPQPESQRVLPKGAKGELLVLVEFTRRTLKFPIESLDSYSKDGFHDLLTLP